VQKKNGVETSFCTAYGTANAYETLARFYGYKLPENFAERYNGVLGRITSYGGSPHEVAETFRLFGVISEELLPFSEEITSWEQYASPNPMVEEFIRSVSQFSASLTSATNGCGLTLLNSLLGNLLQDLGVEPSVCR